MFVLLRLLLLLLLPLLLLLLLRYPRVFATTYKINVISFQHPFCAGVSFKQLKFPPVAVLSEFCHVLMLQSRDFCAGVRQCAKYNLFFNNRCALSAEPRL